MDSFTAFALLFLPVFLAIIIGIIQSSMNNEKEKKEMTLSKKEAYDRVKSHEEAITKFTEDAEYIATYENTHIVHKYLNPCAFGQTGLVITDDKVFFFDIIDKTLSFHKFPFKDLIDVKLILEEEHISENNSQIEMKGGSIGRAVVGGVLAGGAGAIVGAQTGNRNGTSTGTSISQKNIKSATLAITVDDIQNPVYEIPFKSVHLHEIWKKTHIQTIAPYKVDIEEAKKFEGVLKVICERNRKNA